jgi:hypothetical protein
MPHEVITREAAHAAGRRFYYTGEPCKWGHVAPRYVTTSGCVDCLKKFKPRLNPYSKDKVPFMPSVPLWRSRRFSDEQLAQLAKYVQTCIDAFEAHVLPPVCATCNGTRYVPVGPGSGGEWKACEACQVPEPSTADVPTGTEVAT